MKTKTEVITQTIIPRLLTLKEAAQVLGVSDRKLWQMTRRGEIAVTSVGERNKRYSPKALQEYIERQTVTLTSE